MKKKSIFSVLYVQVLIGITLGILLGHFFPPWGAAMKPFGDGFIKLIKMIIAPIIFGTIVVGIAKMGDMKKVGRVGVKALIYFEVVTTFALIIGIVVAVLVEPGGGMHVDVKSLDASAVAAYASAAQKQTTVGFLMNIIPGAMFGAFATGDILQVLLISCLFGAAVTNMGEKGKQIVTFIDEFTHVIFGIMGFIMRVAPLGAFGAMGFTIGRYGLASLLHLALLMGSFYLTCVVFIFGVLGFIAKYFGNFNIWSFIKFIKEEFLIVLGTSSTESVLPRMLKKMEVCGCSKSVVGLVVPTGYSFNLDGTSIYLTMAAFFVAQACDIHLSWIDMATILGVLLLTSKGAAAVTGGGFICLAATFSALPMLPVAGLTLILGIDRFMSEARALTNLIGYGVATVIVAKWENALDEEQFRKALAGELSPEETEFVG